MTESAALVLVVEDELALRRFLKATLTGLGYRYVEATTGEEALLQASAHNPDLVLLDLGLPDLDGLVVVRRLRAWSSAPVIVISARGQEADKIAALDLGADDYLTKPIATGELLARRRVALRHAAAAPGERAVFEAAHLKIDLVARRVFVKGEEVHLTPIEYKLLTTLVQHAGKALTHGQLLKAVWGPAALSHTQYVRVHMGHLRQKLEPEPARPRLLVTETGVGYRLKTE